jgi:hypothetical protein
MNLLDLTRRTFLGQTGLGIGAIAAAAMQGPTAHGGDDSLPGSETSIAQRNPLAAKPSHFVAKAKAVIYLHMAGAPSQLDLFDYKPELQKYSGKACPKEYLEGKRFAFITGVPNMLGTPFKFAQHGSSGAWLSELWRDLPKVVDQIAFVKTVKTDQFNHSPAQLLMQTGTQLFGGASIGSWVTYGLGSENQDLPGFVVLASGGRTVDAGKSIWGSGYLPSVYQGVQCRTTGDPVLFLSNPPGLDGQGRRQTLDALAQLNQMQLAAHGDPDTATRIAQYELAYRMQSAVPKAMDLRDEPQHILDLYGAKPGFVPESDGADDPRTLYRGDDAALANNCLLARRLVESGVRFVQIYDWGWDHHGISPGEDIPHTLPIKTQQVDRALTALLTDLQQRGMLESTLVVWGSEFGRTPMQQNTTNQPFIGRDHHPYAFTMMMAGGGVRPGVTIGETDPIGYYPVGTPHDVRDVQATILHLLGLDAWKLTYPYQGLEQRLIGVQNECRLIDELIA